MVDNFLAVASVIVQPSPPVSAIVLTMQICTFQVPSCSEVAVTDVCLSTTNALCGLLSAICCREVLDSQFAPSKFPRTFMSAVVYVTSTLTLPNAVFTFLAFPEAVSIYGKPMCHRTSLRKLS